MVGCHPVGLPRLRTFKSFPATLADPREIGRLTSLEFLRVGPAERRTLLDADAVPRTLAAATKTAQPSRRRSSRP